MLSDPESDSVWDWDDQKRLKQLFYFYPARMGKG